MAESVHDELLRISDELSRRELYGAAQAMVRGARRINELEQVLDRALQLCSLAQADLSDDFPEAAQSTLVKLAEVARAALKTEGREG